MSFSALEVQKVMTAAARGAGFAAAPSDMFGRAAVWHLALDGRLTHLEAALDNPLNSPILRLPLLIEDVQRAALLTGPELSLTFHAADSALLPAYLQLLPKPPERMQITPREGAPPQLWLRFGDRSERAVTLPGQLTLPATFLRHLRNLGTRRPAIAARTTGLRDRA